MKIPPLLTYSVLRLLAFLVPLAILLGFFPIFREFWWLAVLFAALIGVSISLIFLRAPLTAASTELHERRTKKSRAAEEDADVEDAANDAASEAATGEE